MGATKAMAMGQYQGTSEQSMLNDGASSVGVSSGIVDVTN